MEQARSKKPLIFFVGVLILSIAAVFLLVDKCSSEKQGSGGDSTAAKNNGNSKPDDGLGDNDINDAQSGHSDTPEELVGHIIEVAIQANDSRNAQDLIKLLGQNKLTPAQISRLTELAAQSRLKPDPSKPFSQVPATNNRWSLNLSDNTQIHIDLSKTADGKWQIAGITLPTTQALAANALADANKAKKLAEPVEDSSAAEAVRQFIDAITRLDPAGARQYIDATKVPYSTLAGLCIIFEEGDYRLPEQKALRNMFLRETTSGWLVRVQSKNKETSAMFAINSKRKDIQSPWQITEINLDDLLADYSNRLLGGDIHYSPLIKNPKGGDSLAIYFDLNAKDLTPRTKRQLAIVANLLSTAKEKKLTISGHTDALGTDQYNLSLSRERANQVMQFLAEKNVDRKQMSIAGYGKAKPRLPNTTGDGSDNPEGRRANRRAEILLDF